jgi:hypothetical protein
MVCGCGRDGNDPAGKLESHPLVEQDGDLQAGGVEVLHERPEHSGPVGHELRVEGLAGESARAEVFVEENTHGGRLTIRERAGVW